MAPNLIEHQRVQGRRTTIHINIDGNLVQQRSHQTLHLTTFLHAFGQCLDGVVFTQRCEESVDEDGKTDEELKY